MQIFPLYTLKKRVVFFNKQVCYCFILIFIGFLFGCKQKKVEDEKKIVSKQLTTPKTPAITLSRDSALRVWQNLPMTEDVTLTELGIFFHLVENYPFVLVSRNNVIHTPDDIEDDSTRADLYIWYRNQEKIIKIDSLNFDNLSYGFLDSSPINEINWQDINFDGKKELLLKYKSFFPNRDINPLRFFTYNKQKQSLTLLVELESNEELDIDNTQKTITVGSDGGYYSQGKQVYTWLADTLLFLRSITARENDMGCRNIIEEESVKNGMEIKCETTFKDCEQARAYFEKWQ